MMLHSELWSGDRGLMAAMLDRLAIVKMVEAEGIRVPDSFCFDEGRHGGYQEMEDVFENIRLFLQLTGMGTLKIRGVNNSHMVAFSLKLHCLEEVYRSPLSNRHRIRLSEITGRLCDAADNEFSMFEGKSEIVGCSIFIRLEFMHGLAFKFCDAIRYAHHEAEKLIKELKTGKRGE